VVVAPVAARGAPGAGVKSVHARRSSEHAAQKHDWPDLFYWPSQMRYRGTTAAVE